MSILKKRFFAISVLSTIAVMIVSIFLPPTVNIIMIVTFSVLTVLSATRWIHLGFTKKKHNRFTRIYCYLTVSFLLIAILLSGGYRFFQKDVKSSYEYDGQTVSVKGSVDQIRYAYAYSSCVEVTVSELNGDKANLKAVVEFDTDSPLSERDKFILDGTVFPLSGDESYLIADGFSMKITVEETESISIIGKARAPWYTPINKISDYLCDALDNSLSPDTSALTKAMLLGDRSDLGNDTVRDFRRIGISHMLALSGLHVSVILGGLDMILRWFRIGRTKRSICLILGAFVYLGLTGFSLSATRAVIMACMVYLSYIFPDEADSTTSLFLSAFIILAIFPSGLLDIGFWMSFFATLSLIIIAELLSPLNFKLKKKPWYIQLSVHLLSAVSATTGATVGTVVFAWLVFGEISVVSILSNIIFSVFTFAVLAAGAILLVFHRIPYLSDAIAYILNFIVDAFTSLSSRMSHWRGITVSINYDFVKFIIIPLILLTVIFVLIYIRRKWLIAIPTAAAITAFAICLICYNTSHSGISDVSYVKSNRSELLTVVTADHIAVCDMSSGGFEHFKKAYKEITEQNGTEIEKLILTHYHRYHPTSLKRICETYMIREVYLPTPFTENDIKWHKSIVSNLAGTGTLIKTYAPGDTITLGESCSIEISEYYYIKRSVHPMYFVRITDKGESFVYLSSSIYESEDFTGMTDADHIVFGAHGPNIHSAPDYSKLDPFELKNIILADIERQAPIDTELILNFSYAEETYVFSTVLDGK